MRLVGLLFESLDLYGLLCQSCDEFMGVNAACFIYQWRHPASGNSSNLAVPLLGFLVSCFIWIRLSGPALILGVLWMAAGIAYGAIRTRGFRAELISFEIPCETSLLSARIRTTLESERRDATEYDDLQLHQDQIATDRTKLRLNFFSETCVAYYGVDLRKGSNARHASFGKLAGIGDQDDFAGDSAAWPGSPWFLQDLRR